MIGRGSRLSRKKQRIIQKVGKAQYNAYVKKAGVVPTPIKVSQMELELHSQIDEKVYQKRQAKMEVDKKNRELQNQINFARVKSVNASIAAKRVLADAATAEKENTRRRKRQSDAEFVPIPKGRKDPQ